MLEERLELEEQKYLNPRYVDFSSLVFPKVEIVSDKSIRDLMDKN